MNVEMKTFPYVPRSPFVINYFSTVLCWCFYLQFCSFKEYTLFNLNIYTHTHTKPFHWKQQHTDVVTRWTVMVFNKAASQGRAYMWQYYKKEMKQKACGRKKKKQAQGWSKILVATCLDTTITSNTTTWELVIKMISTLVYTWSIATL